MIKIINRIVAVTVIFCLVFEQSGFAQVAAQMPIPAYINGYVAPDRFRPVQLRSISFDSAAEDFSLYLDRGDEIKAKPAQLNEQGKKLKQYFEIGIAMPNSYFWVNLRPDAPDQIIDPHLARTDMGRVLLEADLQLKKDMARFTSPQTTEGRDYWNKLYAKAEQLFGQNDITIPTVTRPWIVPGEILVRESESRAYILKATLKVMLEQDYLSDAKYAFDDPRLKELNEYSSDIIRTMILPKLTREVNSSKKYAGMRQAYYSLILAQWFKAHYRGKEGAYASRIDTKVLDGLTSQKPWSKDTYFTAYKKSFEKGEYNISETIPAANGLTVRQYFSGGANFSELKIQAMSEGAAVGTAVGAVSGQAVGALQSGLIERTPDGKIRDGGNEDNSINEETVDDKPVHAGSKLKLVTGIVWAFAASIWTFLIPFGPIFVITAALHWIAACLNFYMYGIESKLSLPPQKADTTNKDGGTRRGTRVNYKKLNTLMSFDLAPAISFLAERDWLRAAQKYGHEMPGSIEGVKDGGLETEQTPPAKTGGIDFRALPVESQPLMTPSAIGQLIADAPVLSASEMDKNWEMIQKSLAEGRMPYEELKKFVACCYAYNHAGHKKAATEYVLSLLKLEEERAIETPDELKEIVVLL